MRWAAVVPLIGGQLVGTELATGVPPAEIASFSAFAHNDGWTRRRWPSVPFRVLDDGDRLSRRFDLVVSVCPCAGLSLLSTAKSVSSTRDNRNRWMLESAEYVMGEVRPDVYLGENAPAMFTSMGRSVVHQLLEIARKHGYSATFYRTDTIHHGLPQRRLRTFYMFTRDGGSSSPDLPFGRVPFPTALEHLDSIPGDAPNLSDPALKNLGEWSIYKFLRKLYGDRWRDAGEDPGTRPYPSAYVMLKQKQLVRQFVDEHGEEDGFARVMSYSLRKLAEGKGDGVFIYPPVFDRGGAYPAVIKKTVENVIHPREDRFLNAREVMWLMGLPADYEKADGRDLNVICQNVPVHSARAATDLALGWLGGKHPSSGHGVAWACNDSEKRWYGPDKVEPGKLARVAEVWA